MSVSTLVRTSTRVAAAAASIPNMIAPPSQACLASSALRAAAVWTHAGQATRSHPVRKHVCCNNRRLPSWLMNFVPAHGPPIDLARYDGLRLRPDVCPDTRPSLSRWFKLARTNFRDNNYIYTYQTDPALAHYEHNATQLTCILTPITATLHKDLLPCPYHAFTRFNVASIQPDSSSASLTATALLASTDVQHKWYRKHDMTRPSQHFSVRQT